MVKSELLDHLEEVIARVPRAEEVERFLRDEFSEIRAFLRWARQDGDEPRDPALSDRVLDVINWVGSVVRELDPRGEALETIFRAAEVGAEDCAYLGDLIASNQYLTGMQLARLLSLTSIPWCPLSHRGAPVVLEDSPPVGNGNGRRRDHEWLLWACAWSWFAQRDNERDQVDSRGERIGFRGGSEEAVLTLGLRLYRDGCAGLMSFEEFLEVFGSRSVWLLETLKREVPANSDLHLTLRSFLARQPSR